MKIKYFQDTDTLYIEFRTAEVAETKDRDHNTLLDLDRSGDICAITIGHASERAEIPKFSYEQLIERYCSRFALPRLRGSQIYRRKSWQFT